MRLSLALFALVLLVSAGCETGVSQSEDAATSCEGAYFDDGGRCRGANGKFAKKTCCLTPFAERRRDLAAYTCPEEAADGIPVAFVDADSTLRVSRSGSPTANEADDVYLLPFAAARIRELNDEGVLVAIVSNQGGVSKGYTPFEVAEGALVYVASQLNELGARVDYLDFADGYDEFRKPETGMAAKLDELLAEKCGANIDYARSSMTGDAGYKEGSDDVHPDGRPGDDFSNSDRLFAENLGIPFAEPTDAFGWRAWGTYNIHHASELVALLEAIEAEIAELEQSGDDPERLEMLANEVEKNRLVNGLD
jgi:DNA 3'-phosphatase